jgi:hypothetical protein
MEKLMAFFAIQFFAALAIYSVAAIVDRWRETSQKKNEPANEVRQKVAA